MSALPVLDEDRTVAEAAVFPALTPRTHVPHALHAADRTWPETNCSVDLLVEVIHALGAPPEAALGFTVTQDFEGDQFGFFKIPTEDLESLYGIRLSELAIFDAPEAHVAEQVARGRLSLVELDSFFLPDTRGVSYRQEHGKTTVGVNRIDLAARRMEYFHNGTYAALDGEDFEGVWRTGTRSAEDPFLPYAEFLKFGPVPDRSQLAARAAGTLARHVRRRPETNPVRAFQARLPAQVAALYDRPAFFHKYAFNTLRQLGANFELLAAALVWLDAAGFETDEASAEARVIAETAKVVQFQLARAVARRKADALPAQMEPAAEAWDKLMETLVKRFG